MTKQFGRWLITIVLFISGFAAYKCSRSSVGSGRIDPESIESAEEDFDSIPSDTQQEIGLESGQGIGTGSEIPSGSNDLESLIPKAIYADWGAELGKCFPVISQGMSSSDQWDPKVFEIALSTTLAIENQIRLKTYLMLESGGYREVSVTNQVQDDGFTAQVVSAVDFVNGQKNELEISAEQKIEPAESLLASLQSDGKVFGVESFKNYYYENGFEVTAHLWDERLAQIDIKFNEQRLECTHLGCKCTPASGLKPNQGFSD